MSFAYKIDAIDRIVFFTVKGDLTDEGLVGLYNQIRDDPDVTPSFSLLLDLREAVGRDITTEAVRALAGRPPLLARESRRAILVPSDHGFGMARMYETLRDTEGGGVSVFRDYDEAIVWVRAKDR